MVVGEWYSGKNKKGERSRQMTLAETILDISRQHLKDGGLILAQNAEAVCSEG